MGRFNATVRTSLVTTLTAWLARFSVTSRVWIVAFSMAAPMTAMVLFLMVTGINHDIAFAEAELAGSRYQRPLEELLHQIPTHRLYVAAEQAGAARAGTRTEAERAIEAALTALETVHDVDGDGLQFTPGGLAERKRDHLTIDRLRREWKALQAAP